jgi:hypothetical protein
MEQLGTDIRVVWIAGPPRCGSMWTYNITRELLRSTGAEVLPEIVPQRDEVSVRLADEATRDESIARVRVLKMHSLWLLPSDPPHTRFIVPRRDPRDSVMSYMRFMRCSFEQALGIVDTAAAADRHFRAFPRDFVLSLEYIDIIARPAIAAREVARFLRVAIDDAKLLEIVQAFSKENVQKLIEARERDLVHRSRNGLAISSDDVVVFGPENVRMFDVQTGFQSGHVSSYQEGDWQKILTSNQKELLEARIAAALAFDKSTRGPVA